MTISISISAQAEAKLRERARASGEDPASYAARLLDEALTTPSVDELLAPFREQVEASGMSDDQLDACCDQLREKVWQDQQSKRARPE